MGAANFWAVLNEETMQKSRSTSKVADEKNWAIQLVALAAGNEIVNDARCCEKRTQKKSRESKSCKLASNS